MLYKFYNSDYEKITKYDSDDLGGRVFIESRESLNTFIKGVNQIIYNILLLVLAVVFFSGIKLFLAGIILFANIILIAVFRYLIENCKN